jgi:hypothetical protein
LSPLGRSAKPESKIMEFSNYKAYGDHSGIAFPDKKYETLRKIDNERKLDLLLREQLKAQT